MIPNGAYVYVNKKQSEVGFKEWANILRSTECSILVVDGKDSYLFHVNDHGELVEKKVDPLDFDVSNITVESLITYAHNKILRLVNVVQKRYLGVIPQGVSTKAYFNNIFSDAGIEYRIL